MFRDHRVKFDNSIVPVTPICAYPKNLRHLRSNSVATLRR
jgi:hypothetical protein